MVAIMDTISTILGMEPRKGLISCASCDRCLALNLGTQRLGVTYCTTEWIRKTSQSRCAHPSSFCKPHITVPRRRCKYKWLCQSS
jgi:hypothetical protein